LATVLYGGIADAYGHHSWPRWIIGLLPVAAILAAVGVSADAARSMGLPSPSVTDVIPFGFGGSVAAR
jgi:hypothetical protein